MDRRIAALAALVALLASHPALAAPPPRPMRTQMPSRATSFDYTTRVDISELSMLVPNNGAFAFDMQSFAPSGLLFPKGTSKNLVFAGGLWLGAMVGGQLRVAVSEYASEYAPGSMIGGSFDDPAKPEYRTWKVRRWTGDPVDSAHVERAGSPIDDPIVHHGWSEYMANAVPHGAPWRTWRLPDTGTPDPSDSLDVPGPDVSGDLMAWSVWNDADPARHVMDPGGTPPLGIEVQQTTFGFDDPGPLGRVLVMRYRIANRGTNTLNQAYLALWCDPDLGGFTDDLVGCDTTLSLGYAYNATNADQVYGSAPPAVGLQILQGPRAGGATLPMTAFAKYISGIDPASPDETYAWMQGLDGFAGGAPILDPWGNETRFMVAGDPVSPGAQSWLDTNPADRRMLLSSGPFTMAPGDTQDVVVAVIVGAGTSRLASVAAMRCAAGHVRDLFALGFPRPFPAPGTCDEAIAAQCPRTASFWAAECAAPNRLAPATLAQVASAVLSASAYLDPPGGGPTFCEVVTAGAGADLRARAAREFAAFQANILAGELGVRELGGDAVRLGRNADIAGGCLGAWTVESLAAMGTRRRQLNAADYLNLDPTHRRALTGVDWGGPFFFGGASYGWDFFGSTLDPATMPDSFATVELRFSHIATQKAYRFLRKEQADGSAPVTGRAYTYGGHHLVNLQAWDTDNGQQLDLAFVERTVTAPDGTILGPGSQPATFDSTWAPSDDGVGSREYLCVIRRPYSDAPKTSIAVDGAFADGSQPVLYALWSRLRSASDVIDDGDGFRFSFGLPPLPYVDQRLIRLESQPLSDPAVAQEYQDIIDCLADLNAGNRVGPTCDAPTPTLLALVFAEATRERVRLEWHSDEAGLAVAVERRTPDTAWDRVGESSADGGGRIAFEDRDVVAGGQYGYRLVVPRASGPEIAGEAWVSVPHGPTLGVRGLRAAGERVVVALSLAGRAAARLELIDVAGRRVSARKLEGLEPGEHEIDVGGPEVRPGLYFVRLVQGGQRVTHKGVLVR